MYKGKRYYIGTHEGSWFKRGVWNRIVLKIRFGRFVLHMNQETKEKPALDAGSLPEGEAYTAEETNMKGGQRLVA